MNITQKVLLEENSEAPSPPLSATLTYTYSSYSVKQLSALNNVTRSDHPKISTLYRHDIGGFRERRFSRSGGEGSTRLLWFLWGGIQLHCCQGVFKDAQRRGGGMDWFNGESLCCGLFSLLLGCFCIRCTLIQFDKPFRGFLYAAFIHRDLQYIQSSSWVSW